MTFSECSFFSSHFLQKRNLNKKRAREASTSKESHDNNIEIDRAHIQRDHTRPLTKSPFILYIVTPINIDRVSSGSSENGVSLM